jgi:hypothetical protein
MKSRGQEFSPVTSKVPKNVPHPASVTYQNLCVKKLLCTNNIWEQQSCNRRFYTVAEHSTCNHMDIVMQYNQFSHNRFYMSIKITHIEGWMKPCTDLLAGGVLQASVAVKKAHWCHTVDRWTLVCAHTLPSCDNQRICPWKLQAKRNNHAGGLLCFHSLMGK